MTIKKRVDLACMAFLASQPLPTRNREQKQNCNSKAPDCTATQLYANSKNPSEDEDPGHLVQFYSNEAAPVVELKERGGTWIKLSPYGRFRNPEGMQEIRIEDARVMVNAFNRFSNVIARMIGIPWYVGHPDHPRFSNRDTDTGAVGRIKKLKAKKDGLWADVHFNQRGRHLVNEREYHGHSITWIIEEENGVARPVELYSVGFTNNPVIPVDPILHANENNSRSTTGSMGPTKNHSKKETMIKPIRDYLLSIGKMSPDSTEEETLAGVKALANENEQLRSKAVTVEGGLKKLSLLANEGLANLAYRLKSVMDARNKAAGEDGEKITVAAMANSIGVDESLMEELLSGKLVSTDENALGELAELLDVKADTLMANEAMVNQAVLFANEREERAGFIVDKALGEGRVIIAERDAKVKLLANSKDFAKTAEEIADAPKIVSTGSKTTDLADRNTKLGGDVRRERRMLANSMVTSGEAANHDDAWRKMERDRPDLFPEPSSQ